MPTYFCGARAIGKYPLEDVGGPTDVWLCNKCLERYEEFYLYCRPLLRSLTRKVVTGQCDVGGRRYAWVGWLMTWFIEDGGIWPCPACTEKFYRLADVIRHFQKTHLGKVGWEKVYVKDVGEVTATWQGFFCPICGLFLQSEEDLRRHNSTHRR